MASTNTTHIADQRITTVENETRIPKTEVKISEVCFGTVMAVAALYGMWGVVSLLISYFGG